MVDKVFEDIPAAAARLTGLSRRALEYGMCQMRIADRAKDPDSGYTEDEWDELDEFVAVGEFERIGNFKEVMNLDDMKRFLKSWCLTSDWEGSFKRVHEHDDVVLLELEERNTYEGETTVVNSVSVYEFNEEGKLRHLDVYLQMAPLASEGFPNEAYDN